MNDAEKPALRAANDNPWYCLATIHGEQPRQGSDLALARKNCTEWNRWLSAGLNDEQREAFKATFARRTSLEIPSPDDIVDFSHTQFDRTVLLIGGFQFRTPADFSAAKFSGEANFDGVQFDNKSDFTSATFSGKTNFSRTQFNAVGAAFEWATFATQVDFEYTSFVKLNFRKAMFSGLANFRSAMFTGEADFSWANFRGVADFGSTRFSGFGSFTGANFYDDAHFGSATFSDSVSFRSARFSGHVNFVNSTFSAHTIFADARFGSHVPDFRGATMHEATEWHGVTWSKYAWRGDAQAQVYAYERLKQEMERLKKHEDEQSFFRKELRARRRLFPFMSGERLLNFVYQALSNYGNSISRPLLWLIGVFAAGVATFTKVPVCAGQPMPFKLALRLSFANIFVFLNDKRELTMAPDMASCLSNTTAAISAAQSIAGVVLLFLLGLALRNRFRMK
jgi:uncharacterized protein YjbI with pentapeptide repeats